MSVTPSQYIQDHLAHLNNVGIKQNKIIDFSVINWDTLFWSIFCAILTIVVLYLCSRKLASGVPGRFQGSIEMLVEMVDDQAKGVICGDRSFIAPLALSIFVWIIFMNSMDLVPVDWVFGVNGILELFHIHVPHHRVVVTADLNGTMGISCAILLVAIYYGIKAKSCSGFIYELFAVPFGIFLAPINLFLNIVEYLAKSISLAMRLFGNMYAGELVFLLIALLGSAWHFEPEISGILSFLGHIIAGTAWAIFHILIIVLQAFIFMMLSLIYIGQAREKH